VEVNVNFGSVSQDVTPAQETILVTGDRGIDGGDGKAGPAGNGVLKIVDNGDYTLTFFMTDGTTFTTPVLKGARGEDGSNFTPDKDAIAIIVDEQLKPIRDDIEAISKDGMLTPAEKTVLKVEMGRIISERVSIVAEADLYQYTTVKTDYIKAHDALTLYMTPLLADMRTSSPVDAATFNSKFTAYYDAKAVILKKISVTVQTNAKQATATAEGVAKITNFWRITLDDQSGLIAAGTILVGTAEYNNAGMTGVTDAGGKSVRFFAGAAYAHKNTAPFRVLDDGTVFLEKAVIKGPLLQDGAGNVAELPVYRGIFNADNTYYKNNTVTYEGAVWVYINELPTSNIPTEGLFWTIYVARGDDGTSIKILGTKASVAELPTVDNKLGDCYVVSGDLYVWVAGAWVNVGKLQGDAGAASYLHQKYSNDGGKTFTAPDGETPGSYLGLYADHTPEDSNLVTAYKWALIRGADGANGTEGAYTEFRFAKNGSPSVAPALATTTAAPSGWTTAQPALAALEYMWMTSTKKTAAGAMTGIWSTPARVNGADGEKGPQGIDGPKGADGIQLYTWLKYADSPTAGMSDTPDGKLYIGLAYNKTTSSESNTYSDYMWTLIAGGKGDQGIEGPKGADGQTLYTWIKYGDSGAGAGMSDSPAGKKYIGIAYNKALQQESTNPNDYLWSLITGADGAPGPRGPYVLGRGTWSSSKEYYGGSDRVEVVKYNSIWYVTQVTAGNIAAGTLPTNSSKYNPFGGQFESVATQLLFAELAYIENLSVGMLDTRLGGAGKGVTINLNKDNALKSWYANGQAGIVLTAGDDGEPTLRGYDINGNERWNLGAGSSQIVFVKEVPESYGLTNLALISTNLSLNQIDLDGIMSSNNKTCRVTDTTSPDYNYVGVNKSIAAYNYNAGSNSQSAANAQYQGYKTTNGDKYTNIPNGWYTFGDTYLGTISGEKYNIWYLKIVDGVQVEGIYSEIEANSTRACGFTTDSKPV
jgi:hypothetical protein